MVLDVTKSVTPDGLASAAHVFKLNCVGCHGVKGDGDGAGGRILVVCEAALMPGSGYDRGIPRSSTSRFPSRGTVAEELTPAAAILGEGKTKVKPNRRRSLLF